MVENMKEKIAESLNGIDVYAVIDNPHMEAHKYVQNEHIAEAIARCSIDRGFGIYTVEFDHIIGKNDLVETTEDDDVRYEKRAGRNIISRVVHGRESEDTNLITVSTTIDEDDGLMTLVTAFYGPQAPREMTDPRLTDEERPESVAFWSNHALVAK